MKVSRLCTVSRVSGGIQSCRAQLDTNARRRKHDGKHAQRQRRTREGWMLNYKLPATGGGASLCHSNLNCHCVRTHYSILVLLSTCCNTSRNGYCLPSCSSLTNPPFFHLINMRASGCVFFVWAEHVTQQQRSDCLLLDLWYSTRRSNRYAPSSSSSTYGRKSARKIQ